ncbi:hypothetical protein Tco_1265630, partial [Tanacetum coccineum]
MSQNPNEQGHFTNLFNLNPSYQQETGSNPSTPSSQHSISSSSFQQYPGFGTQYGTPLPSPEQIFRQQQQAFFNHQLNNQFQNFQQQKNTPFQILQKQPEAFHQSKPQPQPSKDNHRGKRVAKRATVDLVDDDEEEEEHIRIVGLDNAKSGTLRAPRGAFYLVAMIWKRVRATYSQQPPQASYTDASKAHACAPVGARPYQLLTLIIDHAFKKRCKQRAKAQAANSLSGTAEVPPVVFLNTANATSAVQQEGVWNLMLSQAMMTLYCSRCMANKGPFLAGQWYTNNTRPNSISGLKNPIGATSDQPTRTKRNQIVPAGSSSSVPADYVSA